MVKRSKILIKKIEGLKAQEEKHRIKLETENGIKDITFGYWQKEIKGFQKQEEILKAKLRKIKGDNNDIYNKQTGKETKFWNKEAKKHK